MGREKKVGREGGGGEDSNSVYIYFYTNPYNHKTSEKKNNIASNTVNICQAIRQRKLRKITGRYKKTFLLSLYLHFTITPLDIRFPTQKTLVTIRFPPKKGNTVEPDI